jgi:hypothetical protein
MKIQFLVDLANSYYFIYVWHNIQQIMLGWFLVFNATFNNISVISWRSFLLAEETREPGENPRPVACHWQA